MHIIITPYTNKELDKATKIHSKLKNKKSICCDDVNHCGCAKKETCSISIHPELKKSDGTTVTIDDLPDDTKYGNGVTCLGTGLMLKNGEKIPCVIAVFEDDVGISCTDVEKIANEKI